MKLHLILDALHFDPVSLVSGNFCIEKNWHLCCWKGKFQYVYFTIVQDLFKFEGDWDSAVGWH